MESEKTPRAFWPRWSKKLGSPGGLYRSGMAKSLCFAASRKCGLMPVILDGPRGRANERDGARDKRVTRASNDLKKYILVWKGLWSGEALLRSLAVEMWTLRLKAATMASHLYQQKFLWLLPRVSRSERGKTSPVRLALVSSSTNQGRESSKRWDRSINTACEVIANTNGSKHTAACRTWSFRPELQYIT